MTVDEFDKLNDRLESFKNLQQDIEDAEELIETLETDLTDAENFNINIKATYYPSNFLSNPDVDSQEYIFADTTNNFYSLSGSMFVEVLKKHVEALKQKRDEL